MHEAKVIIDSTAKAPKYMSYTNVIRNILTPDTADLKFIPPLPGDDPEDEARFKKFYKELEEAHTRRAKNPTRQLEKAARIRTALKLWLNNTQLEISEANLVQYVVSQQSASDLDCREDERDLVLKYMDSTLDERAIAAAELFWEAFEKVFDMNLVDVILPADRFKEMVEHVGKKPNADPESMMPVPSDRLGTYASLTCMICAAFDCQTHADYSSDVSYSATPGDDHQPEYLIQRQPLVLPYNDMLRQHNLRKKVKIDHGISNQVPRRRRRATTCSDHCWKIKKDSTNGDMAGCDPARLSALRETLIAIAEKDRQACRISFMWDIPCWQVHEAILECVKRNGSPPLPDDPLGRAKRPDWYDNRRKTLHNNFSEMTSAHDHEQRSQASPVSLISL